MATNIISDPSHVIQVSPEVVSRLVATESPNIFKLQRKDFAIASCEESGGFVKLTTSAEFTGNLGDSISIYDDYSSSIITGKITDIQGSPANIIITDVTWVSTYDFSYLNDSTLFPGYYFEGRLTVNSVLETMTVIATPDSKGLADLDVSGILRIKTSLLKTGDYTTDITKEISKSGKFTFEYRGMYRGASSSTAYTSEGNTWYYVESIRSEEQGSNLYDYLATSAGDVPFFNQFDSPVYFLGLPFDLSFFLPDNTSTNIVVTIKRYNSSNTLLGTTTKTVSMGSLEGYINSLNIDPAIIENTASYMTVEIDVS
jgi:hypothetical protein